MKLGHRMSAAGSTVGMQSNTAKVSDLATFLFMLASSLDKWVVPNPAGRVVLSGLRGDDLTPMSRTDMIMELHSK
jgi:hypothetical protein